MHAIQYVLHKSSAKIVTLSIYFTTLINNFFKISTQYVIEAVWFQDRTTAYISTVTVILLKFFKDYTLLENILGFLVLYNCGNI
jgi:hypothetical protein